VLPVAVPVLPRPGRDRDEVATRFRVLLLARSLSRRGPPLLLA